MKTLFLFLLSAACCFGQGFRFSDVGWLAVSGTPKKSAVSSGSGIFVDTVAGNDANDGTTNSPVATWGKALSLGTEGIATNVYVKRGSIFRPSLAGGNDVRGIMYVPTNWTVDCYGIASGAPAGLTNANWPPQVAMSFTNAKPVVSGAILLTNSMFSAWGPAESNMFTYHLNIPLMTNTVQISASHSNVLQLYENNRKVGHWTRSVAMNTWYYTTNCVYTNANSWFYDPTNKILYCHLTNGSPATNLAVYEASISTLSVVGATNVTVNNIHAEKAGAFTITGGQGYQIWAKGGGTYNYCHGWYSWNHNIGTAISTNCAQLNFLNCFAHDADDQNDSVPTLFIAYIDSIIKSPVLFSNCLASQLTYPTQALTGFYCHDSLNAAFGTNRVDCKIQDCVAMNLRYGIQTLAGITNITHFTATNCSIGINLATDGLVLSNNYFYGCSSGIQTGNYVTNLISVSNSFSLVTNFIALDPTGVAFNNQTTNICITNCIFAGNIFGGTVVYGSAIKGSSTTPIIISAGNSFYKIAKAYIYGQIGYADYNNYYGAWALWYNYLPYPYLGNAMATRNTRNSWFSLDASYHWKDDWNCDANCTTTDLNYPASWHNYTVVDPSGN